MTSDYPALSLDPAGHARPAFLRLGMTEDWRITHDWPSTDPDVVAGLAISLEIPPRARGYRIEAFRQHEETRRQVERLRAGWTRVDAKDTPAAMLPAIGHGQLTADAAQALHALRTMAMEATRARGVGE